VLLLLVPSHHLAVAFLTVLLLARLRVLHEICHAKLVQQLDGSLDMVVDLCMATLSVLAGPLEMLDIDPSQPPCGALCGDYFARLLPRCPRKWLWAAVPAAGRAGGCGDGRFHDLSVGARRTPRDAGHWPEQAPLQCSSWWPCCSSDAMVTTKMTVYSYSSGWLGRWACCGCVSGIAV
jgi:hypothetical protein